MLPEMCPKRGKNRIYDTEFLSVIYYVKGRIIHFILPFALSMSVFCLFLRKHFLQNMALIGCSYAKRVVEVNRIYDEYSRTGLPNRTIWRKYIWPVYGISEKTFYNYINAAANPAIAAKEEALQLSLF